MAMFLIAGGFRITGAQPDGDSIRFTPNDPATWPTDRRSSWTSTHWELPPTTTWSRKGWRTQTYYRGLFPDLRNELTAAAKQGRDAGLGVCASDETTKGFDVTGLEVLQDDIVIVPMNRPGFW